MSAPVTILLATRDGEGFLAPQLASYLGQDTADWALWVSDDGSRDLTCAILDRFRSLHPSRDIRLVQGPRGGLAANFLSLLAAPDLPDTMVALSDQDDVWFKDRLSRGARMLAEAEGPAIYAAATTLTDAGLNPLRRQLTRRRRASFSNALAQNILAGNTIMLNRAAVRAVRAAMPRHPVPFHDWWLYLFMTGIGAQVIVDPRPCLYYRQHAGNLLGARGGLRATARRAELVLDGTYRRWIGRNLRALNSVWDHLTPTNRELLSLLTAPPGAALRPGPIWRAGIHREGVTGRLVLPGLALAGLV